MDDSLLPSPERISKFSSHVPIYPMLIGHSRCPAHALDATFLSTCRIRSFDPRRLGDSPMNLLFQVDCAFGDGITGAQFRRIFDRCVSCRHFVYTERRHSHRCEGPILHTQADKFDLVAALLTYDEHAGLSLSDVQQLFARCDACQRVCRKGSINLHDCPVLGS